MTAILKRGLRNLPPVVVSLCICLSAGLLTGSCTRAAYVPVQSVHSEQRADTLRTHAVYCDSVIRSDSVTVLVKGDTVRIDRWHVRERVSIRHDTVYRDRYAAIHDSVPQPYPVEVVREVAKPLRWWEAALMWAGGIAVAVLGIILFIKLRR